MDNKEKTPSFITFRYSVKKLPVIKQSDFFDFQGDLCEIMQH